MKNESFLGHGKTLTVCLMLAVFLSFAGQRVHGEDLSDSADSQSSVPVSQPMADSQSSVPADASQPMADSQSSVSADASQPMADTQSSVPADASQPMADSQSSVPADAYRTSVEIGSDVDEKVDFLGNKDDSVNIHCRDYSDDDEILRFSSSSNRALTESEQSLLSALELDEKKISEVSLSRIRSFSQDTTLDYLLSIYQAYQSARNASGMLDDSELSMILDEQNDLDARDRVTVMQTVFPLLVDYAVSQGDASTIRKFSSSFWSYERLWPGLRFYIACQHDDAAIAFGLQPTKHDNRLNVAGVEPRLPLCRNDVMPNAPTTEQNAVSCYAVRVIETTEFTPEAMEQVLFRTFAALSSRDNQLCATEVRHLNEALVRLGEQIHKAAESGSDTFVYHEQWLCQLHIISLMLLEQQRFAELMRLERAIQSVFKDAEFVHRLALKCKNLNQPFSSEYSRLETDHGSAYAWVKKQFSSKKNKKLNKNIKTWIKKGSSKVRLLRRLMVMWALWSEGKYKQAAETAGDVAEGKSRLVHPQLNSLDVILKAALGENIPQQALETYIRVIYLKSPWLVYQTLSEAGRLLSKSQRRMIVDIMRQYNPATDSAEAALFYREFESEIRENMSVQHLSLIDAWLETEIRLAETRNETNQRRIRWLNDLIAAENWQEISGLSELAVHDSPSEDWRSFWISVGCHAQSSCDCASLLPDMPFNCVLEENADSRQAWFEQIAGCIAQQK